MSFYFQNESALEVVPNLRPKGPGPVEVYHCPLCPFWKRGISAFHAHTMRHQTKPAFQCSVCKFSHKSQAAVFDHIRKKKATDRKHSTARPKLLQPIPAHRYAEFLRPMAVPNNVDSGRTSLLFTDESQGTKNINNSRAF